MSEQTLDDSAVLVRQKVEAMLLDSDNSGQQAEQQQSTPSTASAAEKRHISWEDYFMAVAFLAAQRSKDPECVSFTQPAQHVHSQADRKRGIEGQKEEEKEKESHAHRHTTNTSKHKHAHTCFLSADRSLVLALSTRTTRLLASVSRVVLF